VIASRLGHREPGLALGLYFLPKPEWCRGHGLL